MPRPFVLVWDLDRTLGVFNSIEEQRTPTSPVTVHLRPGIAAALERLTAQGFVHTVLTLASPSYAELALRGTGLRGYFHEVAGAGQRMKGDVDGIGALFAIPPEERPHRMLFVGDHPLFDAPRAPDVVFHIEAFVLERPARAAADLVLELRELGQGSLRRGFDTLENRGILQTSAPGAQMKRVEHPGLDPLLLITRDAACPVICYADDAARRASGEPVRFVPGALSPA